MDGGWMALRFSAFFWHVFWHSTLRPDEYIPV
jgi:hypothetical protein